MTSTDNKSTFCDINLNVDIILLLYLNIGVETLVMNQQIFDLNESDEDGVEEEVEERNNHTTLQYLSIIDNKILLKNK
jgi:hypothetical protein